MVGFLLSIAANFVNVLLVAEYTSGVDRKESKFYEVFKAVCCLRLMVRLPGVLYCLMS